MMNCVFTPDVGLQPTLASCCACFHSASSRSWSRWYCSYKKQNNFKHLNMDIIKKWTSSQWFPTSPVEGAPALPATFPACDDPPRGPTTSWRRRGWGRAPGAADTRTDCSLCSLQTQTHGWCFLTPSLMNLHQISQSSNLLWEKKNN